MSKPSILLVDGDSRNRRVLEVSLRKAGFLVTSASSGTEAIESVELAEPDLVISDTDLPELDGFGLCQKIKQTPKWAHIPVIFLTSRRSIEDKIRGLEIGVAEYLTRPIFVKEIVIRIKMQLQKRQGETLGNGKADAGRTTFSGDLADMAAVDLIQTLELGRKSGIIHFRSEGGGKGAIYFRNGKIIDAELGQLTGEAAVYRLLVWNDGQFQVEFTAINRPEVIEASNQALMMEGMRRVDEWGRLLEQLPSLNTVFEVNYDQLAERLGDIPDEVNAFIKLIDGRRSLIQIVDDARCGDLEALNIISKLFFEGLIFDAKQGPLATTAVVASPWATTASTGSDGSQANKLPRRPEEPTRWQTGASGVSRLASLKPPSVQQPLPTPPAATAAPSKSDDVSTLLRLIPEPVIPDELKGERRPGRSSVELFALALQAEADDERPTVTKPKEPSAIIPIPVPTSEVKIPTLGDDEITAVVPPPEQEGKSAEAKSGAHRLARISLTTVPVPRTQTLQPMSGNAAATATGSMPTVSASTATTESMQARLANTAGAPTSTATSTTGSGARANTLPGGFTRRRPSITEATLAIKSTQETVAVQTESAAPAPLVGTSTSPTVDALPVISKLESEAPLSRVASGEFMRHEEETTLDRLMGTMPLEERQTKPGESPHASLPNVIPFPNAGDAKQSTPALATVPTDPAEPKPSSAPELFDEVPITDAANEQDANDPAASSPLAEINTANNLLGEPLSLEEDDEDRADQAAPSAKRSSGFWVAAAIVLVLVGGGYYWVRSQQPVTPATSADNTTVPQTPRVEPIATPKPQAAPEPAQTEPTRATPTAPVAVTVDPRAATPSPDTTADEPGLAPPLVNASSDYVAALADAQKLLRRGLTSQARRRLKKLITENPRGWEALEQLAWLEFERGDAKIAVGLAQKAVSIQTEAPYAQLVLGLSHQEAERKIEARRAFEKFLQLCPHCPQASEIRTFLQQ